LLKKLAAPCGTGALKIEKGAHTGIVEALVVDPAHAAGDDAPLRLQFQERQDGTPVVRVYDEIRRAIKIDINGPGIVVVLDFTPGLCCPVAARLD